MMRATEESSRLAWSCKSSILLARFESSSVEYGYSSPTHPYNFAGCAAALIHAEVVFHGTQAAEAEEDANSDEGVGKSDQQLPPQPAGPLFLINNSCSAVLPLQRSAERRDGLDPAAAADSRERPAPYSLLVAGSSPDIYHQTPTPHAHTEQDRRQATRATTSDMALPPADTPSTLELRT